MECIHKMLKVRNAELLTQQLEIVSQILECPGYNGYLPVLEEVGY